MLPVCIIYTRMFRARETRRTRVVIVIVLNVIYLTSEFRVVSKIDDDHGAVLRERGKKTNE